jgi:hypothetical protein
MYNIGGYQVGCLSQDLSEKIQGKLALAAKLVDHEGERVPTSRGRYREARTPQGI